MSEEFRQHYACAVCGNTNVMHSCITILQSKLDDKDKEIEALRGCFMEIHSLEKKKFITNNDIFMSFLDFNLIDETGNPTPLLTGK